MVGTDGGAPIETMVAQKSPVQEGLPGSPEGPRRFMIINLK